MRMTVVEYQLEHRESLPNWSADSPWVNKAYDSSGSGLLEAMQVWRGPALPYDVGCVPTHSPDPMD
jgi:hypothetical protein